MSLRLLLLSLVVAWGVLARRALANPATAEALFREGHRLLEAGLYEEAAAKLEESQAQDPASGTLINLALAYEKQGWLASAWAAYQDAAALARHDGRGARAALAERKHAELEPRVPMLSFHVEKAPDGLSISWGRVKIGAGALDSVIPIDPGEYEIVAAAPHRATWQTRLLIAPGERRSITIPELPAISPPLSPAPSLPIQPPPLVRSQPPHTIQGKSGRSTTLAWSLGATGVVSLGTGAIFGFRALTRYADAEHACPSHQNCAASVLDDWRAAKTSAVIADITLGAGVAACAGSLWLFLTHRGGDSANVALDFVPVPGGAAVGLRSRL